MKFGLRNPRPAGRLHWSAMRLQFPRISVPIVKVDWLSALPDNVGEMMNDILGCCLEAATYHGSQCRSLAAGGAMLTQPDLCVVNLYKCTGWNGTDQGTGTDQGSDAAQVFDWIMANGLPYGPQGAPRPNMLLVPAIEIDPRNLRDVAAAMDDCCGLMVGLQVPQSLADALDANSVPDVWDFVPGDTLTGEGHEVFVGGIDLNQRAPFNHVSWGNPRYRMTQAFWTNCVVQVTALVFADWVAATGKTPLGASPAQLAAVLAAMQAGQVP